jgi:DMSO reductase anchor subunit
MWQNRELSSPLADNFYAISSLIFIVSAITGIRSRRAASSFQSKGLLLAAFAFLSALGFFFLLSIQFDFGRCIFPSRAHPYFTSGRLMSGALIPFALLYCSGVVRLLRPVANRVPAWAALILIVAVASISETLVKRDVFFSEHNWFHL